MSHPKVAAVILAAGSSSRLGRPKQLIEFQGQTLIRRTVTTVSKSCVSSVFVTTADNGVDFASELDGLAWGELFVANPQLGQSQSIKAGVRALQDTGNFGAILFTPCDLPLLSVEHLDTLIKQYCSGKWHIVASRYCDVLGAPLIVGRELWPELLKLEGDVGVRKILHAHRTTTSSVDWEDGAFDLDTPEDVSRLHATTLRN